MRIAGALVIGLLAASLQAAAAQDFPTKPIKLIVPFPAGGPNDIIARIVGQRMSELAKQPVVIDNRGGQGGALGTDAIAKAQSGRLHHRHRSMPARWRSTRAWRRSPTIQPGISRRSRWWSPCRRCWWWPSNVPAANMGELVALAKAKPGTLNFASTGAGSLPHLAGELFKLTARIDIVHVPYRGAAPAVNDLLGQQVQMAFLDLPVILPHIHSGMLKPIALGTTTRAPTAPDVPTTAELGMPELMIENWYGMVAPARNAPDIVSGVATGSPTRHCPTKA